MKPFSSIYNWWMRETDSEDRRVYVPLSIGILILLSIALGMWG